MQLLEEDKSQDIEYEKCRCPTCHNTLLHYVGGYNSVYRIKCKRCDNLIIIYSAGQTVLATSVIIDIVE